MKFEEALALMREGKRMKRTVFNDEDFAIRNGAIVYRSMRVERTPLGISSECILADDWEVSE